MKTIEINGIDFEVKRPRKNKLELETVLRWVDRYAGRTIYDCYDRPSHAKQSIYDSWLNWYTEDTQDRVDYFGVSGYNCMSFSLQAIYYGDYGIYLLSITKAHNTATLIEE